MWGWSEVFIRDLLMRIVKSKRTIVVNDYLGMIDPYPNPSLWALMTEIHT